MPHAERLALEAALAAAGEQLPKFDLTAPAVFVPATLG